MRCGRLRSDRTTSSYKALIRVLLLHADLRLGLRDVSELTSSWIFWMFFGSIGASHLLEVRLELADVLVILLVALGARLSPSGCTLGSLFAAPLGTPNVSLCQ